jgi:hypothetical protein
MAKSSGHSKICGNFGEALILYWLSKNGFECARVDHTGIDIIANNPDGDKLIGISVKSRTRGAGKEGQTVDIEHGDFEKADKACKDFKCSPCSPYFAIIVDAKDLIRVFVTPKSELFALCSIGKTGNAYWKMTASAIDRYSANERVMRFEFNTKTWRWFEPPSNATRLVV